MSYVLAIDQGTTSTRAIIFNKDLEIVASSQKEIEQFYPFSGWVEHDLEEIYSAVIDTVRDAVKKAKINSQNILSIGITNQRETTAVWNTESAQPLSRAIVWQDRRTSEFCDELKKNGKEGIYQEKTGLLIDPYFSATKIKWLLDKFDPQRTMAKSGKLLFGTIDCYLIWRLTNKKSHSTDITNASRTMLFNIKSLEWDDDIISDLNVPKKILPTVKECADDFGEMATEILGSPIPIMGVAGDQQAATIGQACFQKGMIKSTYGTGCFALLNTGDQCVLSKNKLLSTIAYKIDGKVCYALEGSIFIAGAVVQWLRDSINIIDEAGQVEHLASKAKDQDIYFVPAFTGLGAPYWDPNARGAIFGLLRDTGREEIALAALESVGFQTRDLLEAMIKDVGGMKRDHVKLRVDGGMTQSNLTMKILANLTGVEINIPDIQESTAKGVAWLAGMRAGLYNKLEVFEKEWALKETFIPVISTKERDKKYEGWKEAVGKTGTST
ncbi:glycerol kinase GlpK [Paracoccaceae bacterium]|nr:glycerol kinase GlpK [Paracoccaceae bacterium]